MLHKLKKHLILFDTIITCLILSVVVSGACYINISQIKANSLRQFISLRDTIEYKLKTEDIISNTWLSETEASSHLIIQIKENSIPFLFKGSWAPAAGRSEIIEKVQTLAFSEGIDTTALSVSFEKSRSSIFRLHTVSGERVYANVCIIPQKKSFISLTLIQFIPAEQSFIRRQLLLFTLIDLLGCLLLLLVSYLFVNKALRPVEENQKRQNEFIAAASHDLRSPLAVIQTNASALLISGADIHRFVPRIVAECSRMSRLVSDMLILASSDARTWQLQIGEIDLEQFLIDLYDSFSSLCMKKNHILVLDLPDYSLPVLSSDKDRLTQILGILLDNAITYSPEESTITLRPFCKKNSFCLEVEDHGIGISKEHKPLIFHRFYRADHARNDTSHYGLGLSVAKELTELMKGKISIHDTNGGGSTFLIELPL